MKTSFCKKCGVEIVWLETKNGKRISLDLPPVKRFALSRSGLVAHLVDTFTTHFDTCSHAGPR